jgi:predicted Zn-dependent protease
MSALADAGFDPTGMASFFEVISRTNQPVEARVPEFLRTHPVGSARIAEARNRARSYPAVDTEDTRNYGIVRARIIANGQDTPEEAVALFERRDYEEQSDADKYGRALSYLRADRNNEANQIFEELVSRDHQVIAYHIGLAESQLALERVAESKATFERAIELFPRNVPLVIRYAEALLQFDRADTAHKLLLDLLNNVPPTPEQVRLIARAAIDAGDAGEAHYYMAEYRFMIGDLVGGVDFLQRALKLPDLEEIQRIRYEARIDFIQEYMSAEQLQQMRRNRPRGSVAGLAP